MRDMASQPPVAPLAQAPNATAPVTEMAKGSEPVAAPATDTAPGTTEDFPEDI